MAEQYINPIEKCPPMAELRNKLAKEGFKFDTNDRETSSDFVVDNCVESLIRLQTCFNVGDKGFSVISIWFERDDGSMGASYGWPDLLEVATTGKDGIFHDPEPVSPDEIIGWAINARGEESE